MGSNGAAMRENGKNNVCDCWSLFRFFLWKDVKIEGFKAHGNYSDQFWSNQILALLCDGQKPNMSMISGCLTPRKSVFMDLIIPSYFKQYKKILTHFRKYYVCKPEHQTCDLFKSLCIVCSFVSSFLSFGYLIVYHLFVKTGTDR